MSAAPIRVVLIDDSAVVRGALRQIIEGAPDIAVVIRPLLATWRQLREQIAVFDKAVLQQVRADSICRLLMTVPGIGEAAT